MSNAEYRQMAGKMAEMIVGVFGDAAPGLVVVIIANESEIDPARLEIDAGFKGGGCLTEAGAVGLREFGEQLRISIKEAAARTNGGRAEIIDRPDIELPGKRGDA